jgi:hypothetical protein
VKAAVLSAAGDVVGDVAGAIGWAAGGGAGVLVGAPVPSTGVRGALLSMCAPTPGGPPRSRGDVHAAITSHTTAQGRLT